MKKTPKMQVKLIKPNTIEKSQKPEQLSEQEGNNSAEWITPDYPLKGLQNMVDQSTILPQCIRAYKSNIAGFGIGIRYIDDEKETPEMAAEFERAEELIELLNLEQDTKEVFEDLIEARETYGIAYLEVIRDLKGNVVQVDFVKETESIQKTRPLEPYITTTYFHKGQAVDRKKRFCKYKQMIGGKTVYFKEFGDPRIMDLRDGRYLAKGETLEMEWQANEILEFPIGTKPYGTVRWIGQCLTIDGCRRAEILNNNYFINGRHTPLMIMVKGGTLSDESYTQLQEYIDDIKGEKGQHAFLLLETEATDGRVDFEQQNRPEVEIKELASILQQDGLFGNYLEDGRKKAQSSFLLPDLYTGYTTDFNRATAQTAMEITEKQVFQPERKSLAWIINNKLLNGYNFQFVEAYFLEPDITNMDDLFRVLTAANYAGGVTPNFAKKIMYEAHGEVSEDYEGDWGEIPIAMYQMLQAQKQQEEAQKQQQEAANKPPEPGEKEQEQPEDSKTPEQSKQADKEELERDNQNLSEQLEKQIQKAIEHNDDEIVAVLKEVKKALTQWTLEQKKQKREIIKGEFDEGKHPRGPDGKFISSGYVEVGSEEFVNLLDEAKTTNDPDNAWRVDTTRSAADFDSEGIRMFKTDGGSTFAITKDGDIISVCKNKVGDEHFNARKLMAMAVKEGGTHLDSYKGNYGFYVKCGFEVVSRCAFDEQYAPDDWVKGRDEPEDIYFMKYVGVGNVQDKSEAEMLERVSYSKDYNEAASVLDEALKGDENE